MYIEWISLFLPPVGQSLARVCNVYSLGLTGSAVEADGPQIVNPSTVDLGAVINFADRSRVFVEKNGGLLIWTPGGKVVGGGGGGGVVVGG